MEAYFEWVDKKTKWHILILIKHMQLMNKIALLKVRNIME